MLLGPTGPFCIFGILVSMQSLYLGCSLIDAPQTFLDEMEALKVRLREQYDFLEFVGLDNSVSAADVYAHDIERAGSADLMLAICDRPSSGMGMEIQHRIELGKETILAYQQGTNVSRMLLGAVEHYPFVHKITYTTLTTLPVPLSF